MIQRRAKILQLIFGTAVILSVVVFSASTATAGIDLNFPGVDDSIPSGGKKAPQLIGNLIVTVIEFLLSLSAIVAVGAIIWGGMQIMTGAATGGESKSLKGKNTILYAIIGLIITGLSFFIIELVRSTLIS